MNIKTDKFWNSDKSLKELQKIEKRLEAMVERSQSAIAKQSDWRYKTTKQHQLYKELLEGGKHMPAGSKLETIQSINTLQGMLRGKGATLKGTKEMTKQREADFIGRAVARGVEPHKAKEQARSKAFYDFLHSETYKKLATSTGKMGSPKIQAEYMKTEGRASDYYEKLVMQHEAIPSEFTYKELEVPGEFLSD